MNSSALETSLITLLDSASRALYTFAALEVLVLSNLGSDSGTAFRVFPVPSVHPDYL